MNTSGLISVVHFTPTRLLLGRDASTSNLPLLEGLTEYWWQDAQQEETEWLPEHRSLPFVSEVPPKRDEPHDTD